MKSRSCMKHFDIINMKYCRLGFFFYFLSQLNRSLGDVDFFHARTRNFKPLCFFLG